MALIDFDEYLEKLSENRIADFQMSLIAGRSQRLAGAWSSFVPTPATPTTSVVLNRNSDVSISPIPEVGSGMLTFLGARLNSSSGFGGAVILVDLLNANGGLSGIVTTEQTTNLPTIALTRYTTGEGVMIGLFLHANIGTTATTVTVKYTNSSGVANRISTATTIGGGGFNASRTLILIPLQAGDTGVRSVESITLAGSTGTAGNIGVYLMKFLAMLSLDSTTGTTVLDAVSTGGIINSFCEIQPEACISIALLLNNQQTINGAIILGEV